MTHARGRQHRMSGPGGFRAFLLSLLGGGATAGVAGYYLTPAWNGFAHCRSSASRLGCAPQPFWGLSPELYFLACVVGVVTGALVVLLGALASLGWLGARRAGYLLVALSAAGVLAYGGFGVGTAAGVAAGAVLIASRASRPPAPSEWSGSLPVGVPPAPRGARRAMSGRPPVTEWDGIVAKAPYGPPGAGRNRVSLPQADRLAAALEKSRVAAPQAGPGSGAPTPVVVLPPPPLGLRSSYRPPTPSVVSPPSPTGPAPTPARARPAVPAPIFGVPPEETEPTEKAWRPEPSEVAPWTGVAEERPPVRGETAPGPPAPPLGSRPGRPSPRAGPSPAALRGPRGSAPPAPPTLRPVQEFVPPAPPPAAAGMVRPAGPAGALAVPPPIYLEGPPLPEVTTPTGPAPTLGPRPVPRPPEPPSFAPPTPSTPEGVVPPGPETTGHRLDEGDRPVQPLGPPGRARLRAWRCPNCRVVNAPWSVRCTTCKTEPPSVG